MEFKDRVANKPNRVKLTYDEGGASVYATVELADEPIEEGTPLNALNMNKLLNKENTDYIIEQGTSGGFTWEKWNSGKLICRGEKEFPYKCNEEYGQGLYFGVIGYVTYPENVSFIEIPDFNFTKKTYVKLSFQTIGGGASLTRSPNMVCISPNIDSDWIYGEIFSFEVIGKWK